MTRLAVLCLAACALTEKAPPRPLRYFAPDVPTPTPFHGTTCGRVRLGRVTAAAGLRLAIARRASRVELVPSDTWRWTEPPEDVARRAAAAAIYARPLEQAISGQALVLDLDVTAFEEYAGGGLVGLHYELRDDARAIDRGDIRTTRVAAGTGIEALVGAIGDALAAASNELADRVLAAACPR